MRTGRPSERSWYARDDSNSALAYMHVTTRSPPQHACPHRWHEDSNSALRTRAHTCVVCVCVCAPRVLQRGIGSAEGGVDGGIRLLKYDHFPSHSLSPLVTRGHPTPYLPW